MDKLIEKSGKVWHACTVIGAVFMVISAVIIVANVILRKFFNAPIFGSTEIVQYLGLAITSFAIVQNEWGDGNITMALIVDRLPQKTHYILNAIELLIDTVVFGIIDWLLVKDVIAKFQRGNKTAELAFPKWIPSAVVLVGCVLLTIVLVTKAILYFRAVKEDRTLNFEKIGRIE